MTCGQMPLGGCANPDMTHDGPCTPWPTREGDMKNQDISKRFEEALADAVNSIHRAPEARREEALRHWAKYLIALIAP